MDWIEKIKRNSDEALKEIYVQYNQDITHWVKSKYNLSSPDAKEIFQITIVILYENVISGKLTNLTASLKSYLIGIAKNKALEQHRTKSKFVKDDVLQYIADHQDADTELLYQMEERITIVERAMDIMGDQCKSILRLFYYQGLSMEDITRNMKYKNSNTTKNLKYKCIKRLHNMLKDHINTEHTKT